MAVLVKAHSPEPNSNGPCRLCAAPLRDTFADLGMSPLANSFLRRDQLQNMELFFPLHVQTCRECFLVQLREYQSSEKIFSDYLYFSSYSSTWLEHARRYTEQVIARFGFNEQSQVMEVASNDGYLLQYFQLRGIPVLGIEPAANVAAVANERGVKTRSVFFTAEAARSLVAEGLTADLIVNNNVLAHVPDLHSFVEGLRIALKPQGVITLEFPHVLELIRLNQFDTIYHEHFSYLSLLVVENAFKQHGLEVFDVEKLPTHGGSLRLYAGHAGSRPQLSNLHAMRSEESAAGLDNIETYRAFAGTAQETKCALLEFLIRCRRQKQTVAGYGAPAKGNTLLNYCGIGPELLPYTVDKSPHKQGLFLPGTHIPIYSPEIIATLRPDYVLILPWNLRDEIAGQMTKIREWGGMFVVPIPSVEIF